MDLVKFTDHLDELIDDYMWSSLNPIYKIFNLRLYVILQIERLSSGQVDEKGLDDILERVPEESIKRKTIDIILKEYEKMDPKIWNQFIDKLDEIFDYRNTGDPLLKEYKKEETDESKKETEGWTIVEDRKPSEPPEDKIKEQVKPVQIVLPKLSVSSTGVVLPTVGVDEKEEQKKDESKNEQKDEESKEESKNEQKDKRMTLNGVPVITYLPDEEDKEIFREAFGKITEIDIKIDELREEQKKIQDEEIKKILGRRSEIHSRQEDILISSELKKNFPSIKGRNLINLPYSEFVEYTLKLDTFYKDVEFLRNYLRYRQKNMLRGVLCTVLEERPIHRNNFADTTRLNDIKEMVEESFDVLWFCD